MPTVEELYRNYGILADATEQVSQVGPRAACRARRSAASETLSAALPGPGGGAALPCRARELPAHPGYLARVDTPLGNVDPGIPGESVGPRLPSSCVLLGQCFLTVAFPDFVPSGIDFF
jgi:hypothetical protein